MTCPCGGQTCVTDSRHYKAHITRRRKCKVCGNRFTTIETTAQGLAARIHKEAVFITKQTVQLMAKQVMDTAVGVTVKLREDLPSQTRP